MKNKTKNTIHYVWWNILFTILLVLGFEYEVAGARNLYLFFTWFFFVIMVLGILLCADQVIDDMRKTKPFDNYIPYPVRYAVAGFTVVALVWYGYTVTAVASAVTSIISYSYSFIISAKGKN